ncbi:BrnA antitoxin family protein [Novosphingobium sp. JCM 18896]|uniref:BrnA antitoxin family protein n=1 Tax=Novosphingobium sp. JCM 18896 TaxID=2989731 RepID=UPI0022233BD1|nr:BrnA antitoxin family protein [Novosphingobium sp. JCM 18896]MCW1430463.1 BrnA antitoxin family protein [Novosphingobium sp. JCM 18896]
MSENKQGIDESWVDPDDSPEWTEAHFRYARVSTGGKVLREAQGTWTHPGPGRPPSENPKKQVTLRLDPEVIEKFRATGKGWQSRINAELRKALGI